MGGAISTPLREAVENAYRLFSRYRLHGPLDVCGCPVCVSDEHELALRTTPLREIPAPLLGEYTNSAHGDGGDEFLYFLPRYFELLALGEVPGFTGRATCLRRLGEARAARRLDAGETEISDVFFEHLLAHVRSEVVYGEWPVGRVADDIHDHVVMAAVGGGDFQRLLDAWDGDLRPAATLHIAAIVNRIGELRFLAGEAFWPWSDMAPGSERLFQTWLERLDTEIRLETLFLETENRDDARTLDKAVGILANAARKRHGS